MFFFNLMSWIIFFLLVIALSLHWLDIIKLPDLVILIWKLIESPINPPNLQPTDDAIDGRVKAKRLADSVRDISSLVTAQTGPLPLYKVPLEDKADSITGCRSFQFGKKVQKPNRTIMVSGAIGAGKSTLINGMINYILGVQWEDRYRFKLVPEDESMSQDHSQTSEVTVYNIYHQEGFKIDYSLTVVDTPGFGGVRGVERDKEITEQLQKLFSDKDGIGDIDAVCFGAQASLAQLTPTQKYVFDSILSIFGKDLAENIRILVAFADTQNTPVLEAINASGVPFVKTDAGLPVHFKFNNSALFADNTGDKHFDLNVWNTGTESMKEFFDSLNQIKSIKEKQDRHSPSLKLSSDALDGRVKPKRLADSVRERSSLLPAQTGPLRLYKVPLEDKADSITGCRSFQFGKKVQKPNRTIMVSGAIGAGKSTLINGMINYILGVQWEDWYRFKLVHEDESTSQDRSQTSEVTVYNIYPQEGFKIDYSLTVVDTPGFGGVRGVERDKEITEQLQKLFSDKDGIGDIDAVCFVAQASLAQLTPTQKYVFDSFLSIFGKDVAENIRIMVTFADAQNPPVLGAINASGVPFPKTDAGLPVHFKFNNSALFADNTADKHFDQMFWKMGTESMKEFFDSLNQIKTIRLILTTEVLKERQELESSIQDLQEQVKLGLAKFEKIRETTEKLKENEEEIRKNENFEFFTIVTRPDQVPIPDDGRFITNCQQCHFTCHYPCKLRNDGDKIRCLAMGSDGYCIVCPGKCFWNVHFHQTFKWEYEEVKEKQTLKELKEKYMRASGEKLSLQQLIERLNDEYRSLQDEVVRLMEKAVNCLNRLKEIALNRNPLSTPEYIELLIEGEKKENKLGWAQRVESLMKMKEHAELIAKVERGEELLAHQ